MPNMPDNKPMMPPIKSDNQKLAGFVSFEML